ncbi:hypothetical protein BpHYR1_047736 [Brachionus plicatilis]|uniref:GHMP kinase N-terminal domain-containing protein n=1 Tax=Brachionus plicatilis TaxID=10195 RepID=A0A3M7PND4_BRAPC|nr:hypothetical protein BpHYR1_047736 [Brachionus plicatilis]
MDKTRYAKNSRGRRKILYLIMFMSRAIREENINNNNIYVLSFYLLDTIKAFKNRRSDVPEKDACGCPTWWPRYLMLDLIPEAIFVNLINDEDCEFIVMDSTGQKQQAKISKFKFWLLEPNVGIGLWPNYWKREEIRCIEHGNTDSINIGISDRIVLANFLKAGEHFLSKKTKIYSNKSFIIKKQENVIDPPSQLALCLYDSLFTVWQIYGIITIEQNQTSLWIKEALKLAFKNLAFNQNQLSNLLDCVSQNDVDFCQKKSQLEKNKIIPVIKIDAANVTKWLSDSVYKNRLIDLVTDSILSEPLAPQLQIAPCKQNFNLASRTFAVISDKLNLITHQIYPFIAGKGDHSINVVGLHPSWFLPGTNLVNRAILFDFYSNLFVESDLSSFLVINHCFLVELNQTNEMENHSKLSLLYQSVGIDVINPFEQSDTRADDKLWIRKIQEKNFNIPKFILLNESTQDKVENFVADCQNGVVLQPSSNSTESNQVHFFDQFQIKEILQQSEQIKNPILSEFKGNVLYKQKHHCVFRFNVVCGHITVASYTSKSDSKIIGLRGTTGLVLDGYCERLEQVVNNLYEKSGKKITINSAQWNYLLGIAHTIGKKVNLAIIGIDMIIESNDGMLTAYVLEVNARPGTLIFGEQLIFEDNKITSVMCPSVDENFCTQLACRTKSGKNFPQTLLDWKIFVGEKKNFISNFLNQRYSCEFIEERLNFIKKTIDDVLLNNFDLDREIKFLLVNGRHRYFGSHTDFLGLGGPTINATSQNEIMSICQATKDNFVYISNSDLVYQSSIFQLNEIDLKNAKMGEKIWEPSDWISFLKACLAYMVINFQGVKDKIAGFRIHFSSCGLLKLNSGIGSSSSSALTSALVLSLNQLFDLNLSTIQLCQTDYAEFFLGKTAGCADKTSILNSIDKKMLFVSSMPEKIITKLCLPEKIVVLMVDSKIPRLNSPQSRDYLKKLSFSDDKIEAVNKWASGIMRKFGSFVFSYSLNLIKKSFLNMEKIKSVRIGDLSVKSLIDREDFLLRDLCAGGRLESFYANKFKRYNLIFRLLKLLPQKVNVVVGTKEEVIWPRKSTLFGLSEVERCHEYVQMMTNFDANNVSYLFDLIKFSHNGDRACVDFRNDFEPTVWQSNRNNHITDELLDEWIENENELLCDKSGGFERSLPIFDEWADQLETTFSHKAALRVSAAGLGGNICVHTVNSIANDVVNWFEEKSLSVTVIKPGPSFKLF